MRNSSKGRGRAARTIRGASTTLLCLLSRASVRGNIGLWLGVLALQACDDGDATTQVHATGTTTGGAVTDDTAGPTTPTTGAALETTSGPSPGTTGTGDTLDVGDTTGPTSISTSTLGETTDATTTTDADTTTTTGADTTTTTGADTDSDSISDCNTTKAIATSGGYNIVGDAASCPMGGAIADDLFAVNPNLGPLADNGGPTPTHAIQVSPAVDAGNPAGCRDAMNVALTVDQRGKPRPDGSACDIGAFERQNQ